jgi:hypothetical protein
MTLGSSNTQKKHMPCIVTHGNFSAAIKMASQVGRLELWGNHVSHRKGGGGDGGSSASSACDYPNAKPDNSAAQQKRLQRRMPRCVVSLPPRKIDVAAKSGESEYQQISYLRTCQSYRLSGKTIANLGEQRVSDRRYRMVLPTMRSRFAYKTLSLCDRLQPFTMRPRKLCEDLWVACLFR